MPVAQPDRVFGYEPKGQGFESLQARQRKALKLLKFRGFCCMRFGRACATRPPSAASRAGRKIHGRRISRPPLTASGTAFQLVIIPPALRHLRQQPLPPVALDDGHAVVGEKAQIPADVAALGDGVEGAGAVKRRGNEAGTSLQSRQDLVKEAGRHPIHTARTSPLRPISAQGTQASTGPSTVP